MEGSLIILRIIGAFLGGFFVLWAFVRFRAHLIRRYEFILTSLFGACLFIVSIYPNSINILAGMMALENKQFGRLIALLIISNMVLWMLVFGLRSRDTVRSIQFDMLVRRLAHNEFLKKFGEGSIRDITVIIPALDEADNLDVILPRMPKKISDHDVGVLVVDDGSTDDTTGIVEKHGYSVATNPIQRGGGAALRAGYDIAEDRGAKIIVTMDGDGQHLPEEIPQLVEPILNDEADFVIGSRVLGQRDKDSAVRWAGIHIFNFIINAFAGTRITDCASGFRAFRVDALRKVLLMQDQFHTAELIIDAAKKGIRIGEAPITIKRRLKGQSKKGKNVTYGYNFLKTVMKTWFR